MMTWMVSFNGSVVPTYRRFPLAFERGQGSRLWDYDGRDYLDFGTGVAVCSIGHAHPALATAIARQAQTLIHTSNLYYIREQTELAEELIRRIGAGKCFFCNSGAEANEALYKLARKFGHDTGRYEILTTLNSFHGRTLAGIAATGQEKVKHGFEPAIEGFRHVPFNDLSAMRDAVSNRTVAILVEGIQGEGGIHPATMEYLRGLRALCNEKNLLLLMDSIQCGMFRTGRFQSYERILENVPNAPVDFLPDGVSLAKGLAGGIPMGATWIRQPYADLLSPGSHGSTFGGTPFACTAALTVFQVIQEEGLADRARELGAYLQSSLKGLHSPHIKDVRGLGLMIGIELHPEIPSLKVEGSTPASTFISRLHALGLLAVPSGNHVVRLLPPLNVSRRECDEAIDKIRRALEAL